MIKQFKAWLAKTPGNEEQIGYDRRLLAVLALFLIMAAGAAVINRGVQPSAGPSQLRLALAAQDGDLNGIETSSGFTLRSNLDLSESEVKTRLKFDPPIDFTVQKRQFSALFSSFLADEQSADLGHQYAVEPMGQLQPGAVYRIQAATSSGAALDHDYSWAFAVKEPFGISESLPADSSIGVPVQSGIEIKFNRFAIDPNASEYVAITPPIDGRFEVGLNKLTFIPSQDLAPRTIYKVTINSGYSAGNGEEKLPQDLEISFETASQDKQQAAPVLYFNSDYAEIGADRDGYLEASGNATSAEVAAFQYATTSDFLADYRRYSNRSNKWAAYNQAKFALSGETKEVFRYQPELLTRNQGDQYGLIKLPQKLPAGQYAFRMTVGSSTVYSFARVSPLAYYYTSINGDGLLWAYDMANKKPMAGVNAFIVDASSSERALGATDEHGLLRFDSSTQADSEVQASLVFRSEMMPETAVPAIGQALLKRENSYQGYLNTDRYAYRLTDQVRYWGVVKGRNLDLRQKKVTVKLGDFALQEATVSPFDTIEGVIRFEGLASGYYNLEVYYNDEWVTSAGIEVFAFAKPLYRLDVRPDKTAVQAGQPVTATVRASFFDGTPVKDMDLNYDINWQDTQSGTIRTDAQGEAKISYTPAYYFNETSELYSDSWTTYPANLRFTVRPGLAEEAEIWGEAFVDVYGPDMAMSSQAREQGKAHVFTAKINKLNPVAAATEGVIGQPKAGQPVKAQIFRYFYVQIPDGERYDPIEKVRVPQYRYETRKELVKEASGATDAKGEWSVPVDQALAAGNGYLKALFSADDATGKRVKSSAESYNYYPYAEQAALNLVNVDQEQNPGVEYKVGDRVRLRWSVSGKDTPFDDQVLLIRYQDGLRSAELIKRADYDEFFATGSVPNMTYKAVKAMPNGFLESGTANASFFDEERQLTVAVKAGKDRYKPRENIDLAISVKDKQGRGVKAVANVAAVDEALFNITPWGYSSSILPNLYADVTVFPVTVATNYVTDFRGGAEQGGCFAAGTMIRLADGSRKPIEAIRVGDEVATLASESSANLVPSIVQGVSSHAVQGYLLINGRLKVTPEHRIYLNGQWQSAGKAKIGDYLIDEQQRRVEITGLKFVEKAGVRVYNIVVGRYHTYLADGIYVHNAEKGGGGDTRNYFEDTPLYKQFETDSQGEIKAGFTAPDNLTSWRVTVNAFDPEGVQAGSRYQLVPVGLPLFVDAVMAPQYLTGDEPIIKVRVFGSDFKAGQPVEIKAVSAGLKLDFATTTTAASVNVPTGKLPAGQYKIVFSAKQGNLSDSLEKTAHVYDNYVRQFKAVRQSVSDGIASIAGNSKGLTELVFVDDGKGRYLDRLVELNMRGSMRADVQAAAYLAAATLNRAYFAGSERFAAELDLARYQNSGNNTLLYSKFPYGSADLALTAFLADAVPEKIDKSALLDSLDGQINEKLLDPVKFSQALYAKAALSKPDLPLMNYLKVSASTTPEAKVYLALAFVAAGDSESARSLYLTDLLPALQVADDQARLEVGADKATNAKLTAAMGVLASRLEAAADSATVTQILAQLKLQPPVDDTTALEEAMILANEADKQPQAAAKFNYKTASRQGEVDLGKYQSFALQLAPAELRSLSFGNVQGKPLAVSYFEEPADPSSLGKTDKVGIRQTYLLGGKETSDFREGDVVLVRLDAQFGAQAPDDAYQIVDFLPSNLKPITRQYDLQLMPSDDCNPIWYPIKVTDEALYFNVGKWFERTDKCPHRTLNFRARVIGQGRFRSQGAVIQSLNRPELINISAAKTITAR